MESIVQALINGILMGCLYGLIALGLSLIYGVMKIVNFAHGAVLMVGMFIAYWIFQTTKMDPYLGMLIVAPAMFLFGYAIQKFLVSPILQKDQEKKPLAVILMTTGLMLFLENTALFLFGPNYRISQTPYTGSTFTLGEIIISKPRLMAFVVAIVVALALELFLTKTDLGRAIRATGQDREAARLMGLDDFQIYKIAFGIGAAVVGIAAALLIPFNYVHPSVGTVFENRSFVIVVLGGIGSFSGALLGGLLVGIIESVGAQFISATWTEVLIFAVFILVLLFKPSGLLGTQKE